MLDWLLHRNIQGLTDEQAAIVRAWRGRPRYADTAPLDEARFVVADTETSGLDPDRAALLSIGACEIVRRTLRLGTVFEIFLRPENVSQPENVLIHQIGHAAQRSAEPLAESLAAWLAYCEQPVFVGFHARFDAVILARHVWRALRVRMPEDWIDVRILLCGLFPTEEHRALDLDGWLSRFDIAMAARHSAAADAIATAQLFLVALHHARQRGLGTVRALRVLQARTLRSLTAAPGESAGL